MAGRRFGKITPAEKSFPHSTKMVIAAIAFRMTDWNMHAPAIVNGIAFWIESTLARCLKAAIKDDPKFSESNATIYGNLIFIIEKALPTCSVSLYPGNQPGSYVWRREYNLTDEAKKSQETRITLWKARKLLCERQVREAAADEYWSEHPQEKATLLQKKAETEAAISQKKENDTYLTAKRKFEEIGEEIDDLGASIGNCGLFENKKRKELRSQVIAKQNELKPHKDTMETFDNEIKALNETLEELNKKLLNPEV